MTNNSIHQARLIVNRAKDMLFNKISRPGGQEINTFRIEMLLRRTGLAMVDE